MAEEAGRTVIGTYLMVPPGLTDLRYVWSSPDVADIDETGGDYNLTIQKQPGLRDGPLALTIHVPARIPDRSRRPATSRSRVGTATLSMPFDHDVKLGIRFVPSQPDRPDGSGVNQASGLYSATVHSRETWNIRSSPCFARGRGC